MQGQFAGGVKRGIFASRRTSDPRNKWIVWRKKNATLLQIIEMCKMSVKTIETEIRHLFSSKDPQVACLSGHWGVGKTFTWNKYLNEASLVAGDISLETYSYVSLFGINSLDDLKATIFFNSISTKLIGSQFGAQPNLETIKANMGGALTSWGKAATPFLGILTRGKVSANAIGPLGYLGIQKTLVCIDDIERRGEKLSARDVLGLISTLRDQKKCQVVVILNEDAIASDRDKADFDAYSEKVIDKYFRFSPTSEECVAIALNPGTEVGCLLAKHFVTLGISNIRVIKKIERFATSLQELLLGYERGVLERAVHSLVLMGWCVYEPSKAPSIDYLRSKAGLRYYQSTPNYFSSNDRAKPTEQELQWNGLLNLYHFTMIEDFDEVLLKGIRDGYFNADSVREHASELNKRFVAEKAGNPFRDAWEKFHGSFANNQEEVIDSVYKAFFLSVDFLTPVDLNGTVWLLKGLGKPELAREVLDHYMEKNCRNREFFDLRNNSYGRYLDEPDVKHAFEERYNSFVEVRDPRLVLLSMRPDRIPSLEDIEVLSGLPAQDYYNIFKNLEGDLLSNLIFSCLQFDNIGNASDPMKEIVVRAKEALTRIGEESTLHAMRLIRYGISVDRKIKSLPEDEADRVNA
jgi:hypothetical protein